MSPIDTDGPLVTASLREWLRAATGLSVSNENQAPVELALRIEAERCRLAPHDLVNRLVAGLIPAQGFIDEVTTHESYFFRAPEQMTLTAHRLVPELLRLEPHRRVRILSLPCARGEEPYSIAMLLAEHHVPDAAVEIVGMDICLSCLRDARRGRYSPLALRRTSNQRAQRWFTEEHGPGGTRSLLLDAQIRQRVSWLHGNLLTNARHLLDGRFDIIFCENLLIYFDQASTERALDVLRSLLSPAGWLFVDHAEWSLPRACMRMQQIGGSVGFRPTSASAAAASPRPAPAPTPSLPQRTPAKPQPRRARREPYHPRPAARRAEPQAASPPSADQPSMLDKAEALVRGKRFSEALLAFDRLLAIEPHHAGAALGRARVLADGGEDFEAIEQLEQLLQGIEGGRIGAAPRVHADVLALMAVLLRKKGLTALARDYLQELAGMDPSHPVLPIDRSHDDD